MINKLQIDFCLGGFRLIIYQWKVKLSSTQVSNTSSSCSPSQTEIQQNYLELLILFSLSICPGFSFPPKTISPRTKETISDHIQQEQSITPTPLHWRPETGHLGVELMTGGNFSCLSLRPPDAATRPCSAIFLYWRVLGNDALARTYGESLGVRGRRMGAS